MQRAIASGKVIDRRYQVQKKIKGNTCNCCYIAEDTNHNDRLVVLSFPKIELLILPGFANAFKDACENLAGSRVSSLIKVLGNGVFEAQPYAVLQNITVETLESVFQRNAHSTLPATVDSALCWATPLAVCLDELHESDYIHSNIRPSNIYIGSQQLLLGDFITEFTLQQMGKFKGAISTLGVGNYLAPEYLKSNYTPSYDQYLLATLIYQALANKPPFSELITDEEYRMQVATKVAEPLSSIRPELSAVSEVIAKALQRNPLNRFSSCRELIFKLQEAQKSSALALKPEKPSEEIFAESIIKPPKYTDISKQNDNNKKNLMWLGLIFLSSLVMAYTVLNQNRADYITSTKATEASKVKNNIVMATELESFDQNMQIGDRKIIIKTENNDQPEMAIEGEQIETTKQLSVVGLEKLNEQESLLAQAEVKENLEDVLQLIKENKVQAQLEINSEKLLSPVAGDKQVSPEELEEYALAIMVDEPIIDVQESTGFSNQAALIERQRIRIFKEKELARIETVTNDCVVGGKVHREAASGNLAFVKSCMAVGVDPNLTNGNRWTLLHIAARSGYLNMSKLLVAKGVRINAKSAGGLTALDMASDQRQSKMVSYLKTRGGVTTR